MNQEQVKEKALHVISSCQTFEQLRVASIYVNLSRNVLDTHNIVYLIDTLEQRSVNIFKGYRDQLQNGDELPIFYENETITFSDPKEFYDWYSTRFGSEYIHE